MNNGAGCSVCGELRWRGDLCQMHYHRFRRHGHFDQTRPGDWGKKSKHPLWERWKATFKIGRDPAWDDFWMFVKDVGDIPSDRARVARLRLEEPIGPKNWTWKETWSEGQHKTRENRNAYMREWYKRNPGRVRGYEMKRHRGMTLTEYDAVLESQGGVCAISSQTDKDFSLAIDHCHVTGKNRGLLTSNINRGLGLFNDDPALLRKAADYLDFWRARHAEG